MIQCVTVFMWPQLPLAMFRFLIKLSGFALSCVLIFFKNTSTRVFRLAFAGNAIVNLSSNSFPRTIVARSLVCSSSSNLLIHRDIGSWVAGLFHESEYCIES